jgi:hypothetical protein
MNPIRTIYVPLKAEVQIEMEWLVKVTPDFPDLIEVKDNYGAVVDVDIKVDNNIVILTPKDPKGLIPNTKYKVTLKGGQQGIRGKNREIMAGDYSFVFYTGAAKGNVFESDTAKHMAGQVAAWKNDSPKGVEPDHEVRTTRFLIHDDSDDNWDSEKMESTLTGVTGDFAMTYTDLAVHKKDPDSSVDFFFRSTCNKGVTIFTALQGTGRVSESSQVRNARLGVSTKEGGVTMEGSLFSDKDGSFLTLFQRTVKPSPTSLEGGELSIGHAMLYLMNDNTLRFWDGKASNEMTVLCSNRDSECYLEWDGSTLRLMDKGKADPKVSIRNDGVWLRGIFHPELDRSARYSLIDGTDGKESITLITNTNSVAGTGGQKADIHLESIMNDGTKAQIAIQRTPNLSSFFFQTGISTQGYVNIKCIDSDATLKVGKGDIPQHTIVGLGAVEAYSAAGGKYSFLSQEIGVGVHADTANDCRIFHQGNIGYIGSKDSGTAKDIPISRIYYKPDFTGYTKDIRFLGGAAGDPRLQGGITFQTGTRTYTIGAEGGQGGAALWCVDSTLRIFQTSPVMQELPEVIIENITIKAGDVMVWEKEVKEATSDWYVLSKFDCEDEMLPKVYKLIFDADVLEDGKVVLRIYNPSKDDVTITGTATFRFLV